MVVTALHDGIDYVWVDTSCIDKSQTTPKCSRPTSAAGDPYSSRKPRHHAMSTSPSISLRLTATRKLSLTKFLRCAFIAAPTAAEAASSPSLPPKTPTQVSLLRMATSAPLNLPLTNTPRLALWT